MRLTAQIVDKGPLTEREALILTCLCQGMSRKQIANTVYRSYGCISKQLESIAIKLDAHSAAEIIIKAVAGGLVSITYRVILPFILIVGITQTDNDMRRTHSYRVRVVNTRIRVDAA